MPQGDLRRHDRVPQGTPVHVVWKNAEGNEEFTTGKTVDVSEAGMRIELLVPVKVGAFVNFRAEKLRLHGSASVRSCVHKGARYLVGLQFSGGLKWKRKADSIKPAD